MEGETNYLENEAETQIDEGTSIFKIIVIMILILLVPVFIGFLAVYIRN